MRAELNFLYNFRIFWHNFHTEFSFRNIFVTIFLYWEEISFYYTLKNSLEWCQVCHILIVFKNRHLAVNYTSIDPHDGLLPSLWQMQCLFSLLVLVVWQQHSELATNCLFIFFQEALLTISKWFLLFLLSRIEFQWKFYITNNIHISITVIQLNGFQRKVTTVLETRFKT